MNLKEKGDNLLIQDAKKGVEAAPKHKKVISELLNLQNLNPQANKFRREV